MLKKISMMIALMLMFGSGYAQTRANRALGSAELGLNPRKEVPPVRTSVTSVGNTQVFPSTNSQSEVSIAVSPTDANRFLIGANVVLPNNSRYQGYYYSTDGGSSWSGGDQLPGGFGAAADPSVAFDRLGNAFFGHLDFNTVVHDWRLYVSKSTNGGMNWAQGTVVPTRTGYLPDKDFITTNVNSTGPYQNYIYVVWTDYSGAGPIRFSRSTNAGLSYTPFDQNNDANNINVSGTGAAQNAIPIVGPGGEVYTVWSSGPLATTGIGFNKSTNGGASFIFTGTTPRPQITSVTQIGSLSNGRYRLKVTPSYPDGVRVDSYPTMAVDRSGGAHHGTVYVVWADQRFGTPDILLIKSTDGGTNWTSSSPVVVNDVTDRDQWMPWLDVGPDGALNIVYYDSRNDVDNFYTEVYVARSVDGGQTFVNYKTSDVAFAPIAIPDLASGYMGDYIGIVALSGKAFPAWMDNRVNGNYQIFTAKVEPTQVTIHQRLNEGSGGEVATVGRWTGDAFEPRFTTPQTFSFLVDGTEVLHADTNLQSAQKYNRWNEDNDVTNHRVIGVQFGVNELTSKFKPSEDGISIRIEFVDFPALTGGDVQFRDPWYIDYNDPDFGNRRRNQGHNEAAWYTRSVGTSGFKPDFSGSFPEGPYRGVFLDQDYNIPGNPYYSVGAPSPQTIGSFQWYFLNWATTAGSASFQNANAAQTGVVFSLAGTTVAARYKAHLGSSLADATGSNSQRVFGGLVQGGEYPDLYHLLYDREDIITTASLLTAYAVFDAYKRFAAPRSAVDEVFVSGGGARNTYLLRALQDYFWPVSVRTLDATGIRAEAKEALCFAILANETIAGRPTNLPPVTGACKSVVLGTISLPRRL